MLDIVILKNDKNGGFIDILFWGKFTPFFREFLYINLSIKQRIIKPIF